MWKFCPFLIPRLFKNRTTPVELFWENISDVGATPTISTKYNSHYPLRFVQKIISQQTNTGERSKID